MADQTVPDVSSESEQDPDDFIQQVIMTSDQPPATFVNLTPNTMASISNTAQHSTNVHGMAPHSTRPPRSSILLPNRSQYSSQDNLVSLHHSSIAKNKRGLRSSSRYMGRLHRSSTRSRGRSVMNPGILHRPSFVSPIVNMERMLSRLIEPTVGPVHSLFTSPVTSQLSPSMNMGRMLSPAWPQLSTGINVERMNLPLIPQLPTNLNLRMRSRSFEPRVNIASHINMGRMPSLPTMVPSSLNMGRTQLSPMIPSVHSTSLQVTTNINLEGMLLPPVVPPVSVPKPPTSANIRTESTARLSGVMNEPLLPNPGLGSIFQTARQLEQTELTEAYSCIESLGPFILNPVPGNPSLPADVEAIAPDQSFDTVGDQ